MSAWRETPFYSELERAALESKEALTVISENDVPDALYDSVRKNFDEKEMIALSMAIVAINSLNRLVIGFRALSRSN